MVAVADSGLAACTTSYVAGGAINQNVKCRNNIDHTDAPFAGSRLKDLKLLRHLRLSTRTPLLLPHAIGQVAAYTRFSTRRS